MYSFVGIYPSFLVFSAFFLSVLFTLCFLPAFIRFLRREKVGQQVRDDGPQTHLKKQGTPTMGGIIMIIAILLATITVGFFDLKIASLIGVCFSAGIIGLVDDYKKVHYKNTEGMSPKGKLILQFVVAALFVLLAVNQLNIAPTIVIPYVATLNFGILTTVIDLGGGSYFIIPWLYLLFCCILLVGMCNAVNLTDGLDGLASGCVMAVMVVYSIISYRMNFLEPAIFAAATAGACAAFLWFNSNPADIFMGDTGSLSLGMTFGAISILTKTELLSLIIGGIFVAEALSVMIQVFYFRRTGKRIFLMAPLHHHFEKKGWGENRVVVRFWMISAMLAAFGFVIYFSMSFL